MIPVNCDPIGHVSPRPRIDLNPTRNRSAEVEHAGFSFSPVYCVHVWNLLRKAAETGGVGDLEGKE